MSTCRTSLFSSKACVFYRALRPECAPSWHQKLKEGLSEIQLTLLTGQYAHAYYLGKQRRIPTLKETVRSFQVYLPDFSFGSFSPRNKF